MTHYDLSHLSVLIVDQHAHLRHILRGIFREFGFENILEAANVDDAYDRFRENQPDLVLTDWAPGIDGIRLLRRIRQGDTANSCVCVMILSANTELRHICTARDAGANQYLARPFSAHTIYRRLVDVIEHPRPYVKAGDFFGPDRRRRDLPVRGADRRRELREAV